MHECCIHTCTCNLYIQLHEENQNSGLKFTSNMFAFETFLWTYQPLWVLSMIYFMIHVEDIQSIELIYL